MAPIDSASPDDLSRPLSSAAVRRITKACLERNGEVAWTTHAKKELAKDHMTTLDATNVIRCWRHMDPPETDLRTGELKYRIHTDQMGVVVKFRSPSSLTVITAWRK